MQALDVVRAAFDRRKVFDHELGCDVLLHVDVGRALDDLQVHPLHADLMAYLTARDVTDVGCITWAAFKDVYVHYYRLGIDALTLTKRFKLLDPNGTGVVTESSYAVFLAGATDTVVKGAWQELITSAGLSGRGGGTVSYVEYIMALAPGTELDEAMTHASNYYRGNANASRYIKPKKAAPTTRRGDTTTKAWIAVVPSSSVVQLDTPPSQQRGNDDEAVPAAAASEETPAPAAAAASNDEPLAADAAQTTASEEPKTPVPAPEEPVPAPEEPGPVASDNAREGARAEPSAAPPPKTAEAKQEQQSAAAPSPAAAEPAKKDEGGCCVVA